MKQPTLESLAETALADSGPILVLTGAGISAESGIPTFRGPEGFWTVGSRNFMPEEMARARTFARMPEEVWRWYLHRLVRYGACDPNPAHLALARLEAALPDRFWLVTQNVDGLHIRAGNSIARCCQIHGSIHFMRCAERCGAGLLPLPEELRLRGDEAELPSGWFELLRCPDCDGLARPHVLWFDECYDEELYRAETAIRVAWSASMLIVVGTSGATNLPSQIGHIAACRGIPFIDIDPALNPFARHARDAVKGRWIQGPASTELPPLVAVLTR